MSAFYCPHKSTLPISGMNANYGCFLISRNFSMWRTLLFGPVQMIAAACDHHDAAMAACRFLQSMDDTGLAVIIRSRQGGRNVGMIRWTSSYAGPIEYRNSSEFWLRDYGGEWFSG